MEDNKSNIQLNPEMVSQSAEVQHKLDIVCTEDGYNKMSSRNKKVRTPMEQFCQDKLKEIRSTMTPAQRSNEPPTVAFLLSVIKELERETATQARVCRDNRVKTIYNKRKEMEMHGMYVAAVERNANLENTMEIKTKEVQTANEKIRELNEKIREYQVREASGSFLIPMVETEVVDNCDFLKMEVLETTTNKSRDEPSPHATSSLPTFPLPQSPRPEAPPLLTPPPAAQNEEVVPTPSKRGRGRPRIDREEAAIARQNAQMATKEVEIEVKEEVEEQEDMETDHV